MTDTQTIKQKNSAASVAGEVQAPPNLKW